MKYAAVALMALTFVLGMQTFTRADAPGGVQKWEYKRVGVAEVHAEGDPTDEDKDGARAELVEQFARMAAVRGVEVVKSVKFQQYLTDAGAAGWELVHFEDNLWVFKRPVK